MTTPPPELFKYTTVDTAIKILENQSFKFTHPNEFNDPFEFLPIGYSGLSRQEFKRAHKQEINDYSSTHPLMSNKERKTRISSGLDEGYKKLQRSDAFILRQEFSKLVGVLCLSESPDQILMWSHYAASHSGIAIGIDSTKMGHDWLTPRPVIYNPQRYEIPFAEEDIDKNPKNTEDLMFTKSPCWLYEKEWRIVEYLAKLEKDNRDGKINYLKKFDSTVLSRIILGAQISANDEEKITALVRENFKELPIQKAKLSKDKFEIEIS